VSALLPSTIFSHSFPTKRSKRFPLNIVANPSLYNFLAEAMSYMLHAVMLSDIEDLVRHCDYPAMQENPLNKTMFPNTGPETKEEEITWHVSSFRETFENNLGADFRQVCTDDRTPVGFALWTLDQLCLPSQIDTKKSKAEAVKIPRSLDICAWREISLKLRSERRRVLKDLTNVWSKSVYTALCMIVANIIHIRTQRAVSESSASTSRMRIDAFGMGM